MKFNEGDKVRIIAYVGEYGEETPLRVRKAIKARTVYVIAIRDDLTSNGQYPYFLGGWSDGTECFGDGELQLVEIENWRKELCN